MKKREKDLFFLTITIILLCLLFSMKVKKGLNCLSFDDMILRKVSMDDECLVDYIRKFKLFNPSTLPYNFTSRTEIYNIHFVKQSPFQSLKKDRDAPWIEALIAVETFVPKIGQRIFLECGALDGVTFSTTLHLERYLNWTGLLIEADARFYNDMKLVHRKAYGVHACASLYNHPSYALFKPSPIFFPVNKNGRNITGRIYGETLISYGEINCLWLEDEGL
ncbi:uncharacterized protein LOC136042711 isoform X1 [Artemia franciscana]|uniref:uncharacterized protein LOC136042711 isoform X1 n=1 Tax=Artemia franciscana TaxID=6661 RepID=UPI0032DA81A4